MRYEVGQVVEFMMDVSTGDNYSYDWTSVKGRIFQVHENFAPQLDIRLENGKTIGIMESEVIRIVPMDSLISLGKD